MSEKLGVGGGLTHTVGHRPVAKDTGYSVDKQQAVCWRKHVLLILIGLISLSWISIGLPSFPLESNKMIYFLNATHYAPWPTPNDIIVYMKVGEIRNWLTTLLRVVPPSGDYK